MKKIMRVYLIPYMLDPFSVKATMISLPAPRSQKKKINKSTKRIAGKNSHIQLSKMETNLNNRVTMEFDDVAIMDRWKGL